MAAPAQHVATEDDLLAMPQDGRKYELVDGAIVVSPTGSRHGQIGVRLVARLYGHVEKALTDVRELALDDELDGGDVVPGFRSLRAILEP